jgi:hypothetical protein
MLYGFNTHIRGSYEKLLAKLVVDSTTNHFFTETSNNTTLINTSRL